MNARLLALQEYPMVELDRRKAAVEARGIRVLDFGTGDPREPTPAFIRDAFCAAMPAISQYPKVTGLPGMRRAAAGYLQRRFSVQIDPDRELLPTQGSKEAIFHLPMVFVEAPSSRDTVLYGVPAYPVFEIGALFAHARTHEVTLGAHNGYLLDPDTVPAGVLARTAVVFLNYPHNPTGQLMPAELMARWVAAAERHGFVLVSDECYVDLYYETPPHSLLEFGRSGCLAVHSLSKRSGMTGYRSGFIAGDAELIARYRRFRAGMGVAPADPAQVAAQVAWNDDAHVAQRRALFAAKRRVFTDLFAARSMRVWNGPATLFVWVEVPPDQTDRGYAEALLEHGILVSPGSFFGPGQERFVRLALVPTLEECKQAALAWPQSHG